MPCNSTIRRSYRRVTSPCVRAALPPELACCCSAPLCLNLNLNLNKKKNGSPFYLSGVTVWWNFCLSVPSHAPRPRSPHFPRPEPAVLSASDIYPDADLLLSPFTPSTTPRISPLQLAGGLARRQAAPLSLSSPSQLTRCQLGCSSPRGLRHENGRRRSTLPACLPQSGNPPGAHIHNESPAQTVRQRG